MNEFIFTPRPTVISYRTNIFDLLSNLTLHLRWQKKLIVFLTIYRLTVLLEEKVDLEAIHDINEEMQENARQVDSLHLFGLLSLANVLEYGPYTHNSSRVRLRSELGQVKRVPVIRIFPSRIPDPNFSHPGSRIRIKEFKYFSLTNLCISSRKYYPE